MLRGKTIGFGLVLALLGSMNPLHAATTSEAASATSTPTHLATIQASPDNPRNSEGDILPLKDGRLALVYTRFRGGALDDSPADLALRTSADSGRTWSSDRILLANEGGANVMSVTLRRLANGQILLFYLRKDSPHTSCNLYVRRSSDELDTLSSPTRVTLLNGYHVVNNDRVLLCSSGRLIVPAALHTDVDPKTTAPTEFNPKAVCFVYYSDDSGRTWHKDQTPITPLAQRQKVLQEPGVVELADGRLWMYIRTAHGSQYGCYSTDGGLHWSEPQPTALASPQSPASIKTIPGTQDLLCVWNDHRGQHPFQPGKRTPLCWAISHDGGQTWGPSSVIENDPKTAYCYTSITFVGKDARKALCSYYTGSLKGGLFGSLTLSEFAF